MAKNNGMYDFQPRYQNMSVNQNGDIVDRPAEIENQKQEDDTSMFGKFLTGGGGDLNPQMALFLNALFGNDSWKYRR